MLPDSSKITITDNLTLVNGFINEIIIRPKHLLREWARITNQTPAVKIGYTGQHLASLITGVKGTRSGARGDDLADGSEVKSCNKVDQADKCKVCGARVMRFECACGKCGSTNIERKDDSKWLFSVKSAAELEQYLHLNRIVLLLMDYPHFHDNNFNDVRISVFEIYPTEERMKVFAELISNHYYNIYRPKADEGKPTNPMNLHPWSFQFYKCNPVKTFECIITDIDGEAEVNVTKFIAPEVERSEQMETEPMPTRLLRDEEWNVLLDRADYNDLIPLLVHPLTTRDELLGMDKAKKAEELPFISEKLRNLIPLRDIVSVTQSTQYHRT